MVSNAYELLLDLLWDHFFGLYEQTLTDVMGLLKGLMGFLGKWMDSLKDLMKCLEDFISFLKVWECWVP